MIAAAASHNSVTLAYMSWLTDLGVCHCFKAKFLVLMDVLESLYLVRWYIPLSAAANASLTLIHGPVIFALYFQYC